MHYKDLIVDWNLVLWVLYKEVYEKPKYSIVIVDEDEDISNTLAGSFKLANFKAYKTKSAKECLNKINDLNNNVDIVCINGHVAADRGAMLIVDIKKLNRSIKIFVLADNENAKTRVLDYGSDEFTTKPISVTTIIEKVSLLLAKKPAEAIWYLK